MSDKPMQTDGRFAVDRAGEQAIRRDWNREPARQGTVCGIVVEDAVTGTGQRSSIGARDL